MTSKMAGLRERTTHINLILVCFRLAVYLSNPYCNLAVDYISKGNRDLQLTKTELRNLFNFATGQTHFLFKGSFFDQIDGVAMGSPLTPVLANLFMGHYERICLEKI